MSGYGSTTSQFEQQEQEVREWIEAMLQEKVWSVLLITRGPSGDLLDEFHFMGTPMRQCIASHFCFWETVFRLRLFMCSFQIPERPLFESLHDSKVLCRLMNVIRSVLKSQVLAAPLFASAHVFFCQSAVIAFTLCLSRATPRTALTLFRSAFQTRQHS